MPGAIISFSPDAIIPVSRARSFRNVGAITRNLQASRCPFDAVFKKFGLPNVIRTDNGVPFASPNSLYGLNKLHRWWRQPK